MSETLGTRVEQITEPQLSDGLWINTGRLNLGTLPAVWSESRFISYETLKSFMGASLADSDLEQKASDDVRSYKVNGDSAANILRVLTDSEDLVAQFLGDRKTELYGSAGLVLSASSDSVSIRKAIVGNVSPTQYALDVYSNLGSSSGIARFKNSTGSNIFDFRQVSGSATLNMLDVSGASKLFLNTVAAGLGAVTGSEGLLISGGVSNVNITLHPNGNTFYSQQIGTSVWNLGTSGNFRVDKNIGGVNRSTFIYQIVDSRLANVANTGDSATDDLIEALKRIAVTLGLGSET